MQNQKYTTANAYSQKQHLHQESPQVFRGERQQHLMGAEIQHISPIPQHSIGSSDYNSQNTNDKVHISCGNRLQFINNQANLYSNQGNAGLTARVNELETPNNMLVKDFYKRPPVDNNLGQVAPTAPIMGGQEFYFESYEDSTEAALVAGPRQQPHNLMKRIGQQELSSGVKYNNNNDNKYMHSTNSNQIKSINSKGLQKDGRGEIRECTDFDLTAKEIGSNKRFDKNKQKNTILSGRTSHSPMDGAPSNSETVKWAFSNKDSQETQKKISIINRESINTQDIISRSLKSHDSRTVQQQQTNSSHNAAVGTLGLKGKMLDFANLEPSSQQIESALFYSSNKREVGRKGAHPNIITSSSDISNIDEREENKVVSFLEHDDDDDIMMNSDLSSTRGLSNIQNNVRSQNATAKAYKKMAAIHTNNHHKYLVGMKVQVGDALKSIIDNTIECPFCNQQKVYDSSLQCSKIEGPKANMEIIKENLEKKYLTSREYYNVKIINDIIYNESTHIVSVFKDYLIYDDISEFLKRFYQRLESVQRLPKMFEFYEKYSKVFPNYVILPENKYLFKNIEKKQRIIDEKQQFLLEQQEKKNNPQDFQLGNSADKKNRHRDRFSSQQQNSSNISYLSNNKLFDSNFINSVANIKPSGFIESMLSSRIENSQFQEHVLNSSILIHQQLQQNMENAQAKRKKKFLEDMDFGELISKFIAKDSESNLQQSTILFHTQPEVEENRPKSKNEVQVAAAGAKGQSKPKVYDYQEKKVAQTLPSNALQNVHTDISKSDNATSSLIRPNSSAKQQDKRLSSGSQHQQKADHMKKPSKESQELVTSTKAADVANKVSVMQVQNGEILNYNIYNNYNQYINNENYYISQAEEKSKNANIKANEQQDLVTGVQTRAGSLQRNQSKNNLHQNLNSQQQVVKNAEPCKTPSRVTQVKKEVVTPLSGESRADKREAFLQRAQKLAQEQAIVKNMLPDDQNRSHSSFGQRSDNQIAALQQSPINSYGPRTQFTTGTVNTCRAVNTDALVSRELSKEKRSSMQNQKQWSNNLQQPTGAPVNANLQQIQQNQMFKNELIVNLANAGRLSDQFGQQYQHNQDYSLPQSSNVRSVEKLKNIEDEITNDYSKYVNEYGLTKTAFAKAVNSIRDKKIKIQNPQTQIQNIQSQPSTTRQTRLAATSQDQRVISTNARQASTSQSRKCSNTRQQQQKPTILSQETANDLYMNLNSQRGGESVKQIRSVRAKTHLSSNNSSNCFQRSSKLSPDKNGFSTTQQFGQPSMTSGYGQSSQLNQTPSSQNFITIKANNQAKQNKGIKIKFPLNSQKENQQVTDNISSNQTPKRIKLQKTKSTSNIPLCFSQRITQQPQTNQLIQSVRGRQGAPDMVIMDELSQQFTNNTLSSGMRTGVFDQTHQNMENQVLSSLMFPPNAFQSQSSVGTFATTSILNSPLSFKQQAYQPMQQQQLLDSQRNGSKGRQSSRNGNQSQHQSQKSINGNHQRASSTLGGSNNPALQRSNSKTKSKPEPKRLSAGSNQSKRIQHHQAHHQPSQSNINQQILQLLMTYQNQEQDMTGNSMSQAQQYLPFQNSLKSLNLNSQNVQSMKDLKSFKQQPTSTGLMKDIQLVKAPKVKLASGTTQMQSQFGLNTQRTQVSGGAGGPGIIMLNQNFKKTAKINTGKSTQRVDSKKRIQQQVGPYENPSIYSSNMQIPTNELSSRLAMALGSDQASMASTTQAEQAKRILGYSKSQDNFDLIKIAAQRAALEQQNIQNQYNQASVQSGLASSKFIQNLKPTENTISLQKIKFVQQPQQQQQQQMQSIQSARNLQQQYGEYDSMNYSKTGPTNIIIGNNFDSKQSQSRRTSGKFNPSSTKNMHQQQ